LEEVVAVQFRIFNDEAVSMALTSSQLISKSGYLRLVTIVALAVVLVPSVFGQTITVSPLVLFAVALMPNILVYVIPAKHGDNRMFSRVFFLRVAASSGCAVLFYAIYRIAYAVGA